MKSSGRAKVQLDAAAIQTELERIYADSGEPVLRARTVWQASRARRAALHHQFTWNDVEAAALHRDEEARKLIQCVLLAPTPDAEGAARGWLHVEVQGVSGYQPAVTALAQPETRRQVFAEVHSYVMAARQRLENLEGFSREIAALDKVAARIAAKRREEESDDR